jgi:hypothetical protein
MKTFLTDTQNRKPIIIGQGDYSKTKKNCFSYDSYCVGLSLADFVALIWVSFKRGGGWGDSKAILNC